MDAYLSQYLQFHWTLRAATALGIALIIAIFLLAIPKRTLKWMSFQPGLGPNWITVYRVVLYAIGAYLLFARHMLEAGFVTLTTSCMGDRLDGAEAEARAEAERDALAQGIPIVLRSERNKALGKTLDRLADKITLLPTMVYQVYLGAMNLWIVGGVLVVDIIGTLLNRGGSNGFGKTKYLLQAFALMVCVPQNQHWEWSWDTLAPNTLCAMSIPFAIISMAFREMKNPPRFLESFNAFFRHGRSSTAVVAPPDRV